MVAARRLAEMVAMAATCGGERRRGRAALPAGLAACRGPKQAKYSAAWLASRAFLAGLDEGYLNTTRLSKPGTMMEGASFLVLERPGGARTVKTLDLLDLYVEHLSWYERRLLVAGQELAKRHGSKEAGQRPVAYGRRVMGDHVRRFAAHFQRGPARAASAKTVAVMPFFAAGQGQGPSSRGLRSAYLNATLRSVRATLTDHVVVAVTNAADLEAALDHGPLMDALRAGKG